MSVEIPGPRGLIRPLLQFNADAPAFLTRMHAEHGDIFGYRIGPILVVSVLDAGRIATVLRNRDKRFVKDHFTREMKVLTGDGLLTSDGGAWRSHRRLVAPTLRKSHIRHYAEIFVRHTRKWVSAVDAKADLHHQMAALTLDIVAEALFAAPDGGEIADLGEFLETGMRAYVRNERTPLRFLPRWVPGSPRRAMDRLGAFAADHVDGLIRARRDRPAGDDLLWQLIQARDEDGGALDDVGLRDEAVTLFLAGHETTALALTYAWYWIGTHPDARALLYGEVDTVLGERPATAEDMARLPVCTAVIKETMRLHPPAWVIGREPTAPVELDGYEVDTGTQVLVPISVVHRDPRRFDAPLEFRPQRWLGDDAIKPGKWDYLPFGGGERVCVGNHFAMMEAVLMLATMAQGARYTVLRPELPETLYSITQRPTNGMPVTIERR